MTDIDLIINDLAIEDFSARHVRNKGWQVVAHLRDGRLRTGEGTEASEALKRIWFDALLAGYALPSIEEPGVVFDVRQDDGEHVLFHRDEDPAARTKAILLASMEKDARIVVTRHDGGSMGFQMNASEPTPA